jgi:hypothetical protein
MSERSLPLFSHIKEPFLAAPEVFTGVVARHGRESVARKARGGWCCRRSLLEHFRSKRLSGRTGYENGYMPAGEFLKNPEGSSLALRLVKIV